MTPPPEYELSEAAQALHEAYGRLLTSKPGLRDYASRILLKAELWDTLMDERDRGGEPRAEALRNTARGAAEDWQEAITNGRQTQG